MIFFSSDQSRDVSGRGSMRFVGLSDNQMCREKSDARASSNWRTMDLVVIVTPKRQKGTEQLIDTNSIIIRGETAFEIGRLFWNGTNSALA